MNVLKISLLSAAILACPSFKAQETQRLTADKLNEYGILYSLPITHLNIEVEAVKTVKKAGPYARYAEKFLGVKGAILADSQSWEIKDVSISSYGVPDLNNQWLAKFKSGTSTFMVIDDSGLPLALNAEPEMAVVERKRNKMADKSILEGTDYSSAFSEEMVASESMLKRAETTAQKIFELRESRNDLVSGNADKMPPDGASLQLMLDELNRQEQALTALFLGTVQTETKVFRFDYWPEKEVQHEVVFRVSNAFGIVDKDDLSGTPVYLSLKVIARGELPVDEKGKTKELPKGALMYCIPGRAEVSLSADGSLIAKEALEVSQFGVEYGLDPKIFSDKKQPAFVIFNPECGSIRKIGTLSNNE